MRADGRAVFQVRTEKVLRLRADRADRVRGVDAALRARPQPETLWDQAHVGRRAAHVKDGVVAPDEFI